MSIVKIDLVASIVRYAVKLVLNIIVYIMCYVTNPVIVAFADERGNLPQIFKYWQTYDDPLDIDWFVKSLPTWLQYDFDSHYKYFPEYKHKGELHAGYVVLLNPKFTLIERLKRYACRVLWLWRNCAYGFSYHVFGINVRGVDIGVVRNDNVWIAYHRDTYDFSIKFKKPLLCGYELNVDLGYKINNSIVKESLAWQRCMIAHRCAVKKGSV